MSSKEVAKDVSSSYAAGAFGALVSSAALWAAGHWGITQRFHVSLVPGWNLGWLFPRIIWGGIYGFALALPMLKSRSSLERVAIISVIPTLVQLLYVFPIEQNLGFFGFHLGALTPVIVYISYLVWAIAAVFWFKVCR